MEAGAHIWLLQANGVGWVPGTIHSRENKENGKVTNDIDVNCCEVAWCEVL
jgi:hypothetical protein